MAMKKFKPIVMKISCTFIEANESKAIFFAN